LAKLRWLDDQTEPCVEAWASGNLLSFLRVLRAAPPEIARDVLSSVNLAIAGLSLADMPSLAACCRVMTRRRTDAVPVALSVLGSALDAFAPLLRQSLQMTDTAIASMEDRHARATAALAAFIASRDDIVQCPDLDDETTARLAEFGANVDALSSLMSSRGSGVSPL
jgi:hypothetical protein